MSYLSCELTSGLAFPCHLTRLEKTARLMYHMNMYMYHVQYLVQNFQSLYKYIHTDTCQLT